MSNNDLDINEDKSNFTRLMYAYEEAVKNNIISLQDFYSPTTSTQRGINDFSILTGIKVIGGTPLGQATANNDDTNTVNNCATDCLNTPTCVGALYTNGLQTKTCQKYTSLPATGYVSDASSSTIIYNRYGSTLASDRTTSRDTINYNIKTKLEDQLKTLGQSIGDKIKNNPRNNSWSEAIAKLDVAKVKYLEFENAKKINQQANSQLQNSGLNVIKAKTIYILFIAALLILSAIYVRDFNFSITIFIILFIMISVYGSIFLGAFLLVVIVLYLVYYAY